MLAPFSANCCDNVFVMEGDIVLISITTELDLTPSKIPSFPNIISCTSGESDTIVMMTSEFSATCLGDEASVAPACFRASVLI